MTYQSPPFTHSSSMSQTDRQTDGKVILFSRAFAM